MPQPKKYVATDGTVTYRVRFRLGKNTSETFASKKAAEGFCRDLTDLGPARAILRLEEAARRDDEQTVAEIIEPFLVWKALRVRSDRTIADYRRDWDRWIKPTFGHRLAALVTNDDVQAWVDGMVDGTIQLGKAKASPKSIIDRHALLFQIFTYAISHKQATAHPCVGTDLPKKVVGQPKGLRPAEWQAIHAALGQINPDAADLATFLLASGWRWSEATALSTYEVEDTGTRMWVTMGQVVRRNAAGQHLIVEDGKGGGSMRRIELDDDVRAMVRGRVTAASPGSLVFTTGTSAQNGLGGSQWSYSNFTRRYWEPAIKAANLHRRPTPHWLRHTAVFWLALTGSTLPELQSRIGHKSITTTINVYGRMLTDVQPGALAQFAAMRSGTPPVD